MKTILRILQMYEAIRSFSKMDSTISNQSQPLIKTSIIPVHLFNSDNSVVGFNLLTSANHRESQCCRTNYKLTAAKFDQLFE